MSGRAKVTTVLLEDERDRAKAIGADSYLRSKRYRLLHEKHIFKALDASVESMAKLKFPNPYEGRILGALASVLLRHDRRAIGYLRKRKIKALDDDGDRGELFKLAGLLVAEQYLSSRKDGIPAETTLTPPTVLLDGLSDMFEQMAVAGEAMQDVEAGGDDLLVTIGDPDDTASIARALIEGVIGTYESLVPEAEEGDSAIPDPVQRRSLAKAAFLRLGVDDLGDLAASEGHEGLPTKDAMARALSEQYQDDLEKVAKLVLRKERGDPDFGLVTRLVPLNRSVDLGAVRSAFLALQGRYFEPRTALFFIFGDVSEQSDQVVRASGRIRSFLVNPAEAGGKTQLNFRPYTEDVGMVLRSGEAWAEVRTRRASDLRVVRTVLRRTGEVDPAGAVPMPTALQRAPYSSWDPRTLWMLDFLRRDLQAGDLHLDNTLMANFVSPEAQSQDESDGVPSGDSRRPAVDSVRLKGTQLHEHPEACARIVGRAHLRDIEVRVRRTDSRSGYSKLVRMRLSWEDDHLAVLSGADGDNEDAAIHRELVGLVRRAGQRDLNEDNLLFMLRGIERRAAEGIVGDDAGSLLGDPDQQEGTGS